jgi:hypothetical protein
LSPFKKVVVIISQPVAGPDIHGLRQPEARARPLKVSVALAWTASDLNKAMPVTSLVDPNGRRRPGMGR